MANNIAPASSHAAVHRRQGGQKNAAINFRRHQTTTISPRHPIIASAFILILSTTLNQCCTAAPSSISGMMQSGAAGLQQAAQGNLVDSAVVSDLTHLMGEDKKEWMIDSPSSDAANNIGSRFLQVVEDDHEEGEDDHDHAGEEVAAVVEEILINGTAVIGEIFTEAVDAIEGEDHAEEDGDHHEEGEDHMEEDHHEEDLHEGDHAEEDHHDEEDHVEEALHEEDHHDEDEHHDDVDHAAEGSDGHDDHHDDHEDEHLESEGHDDDHEDEHLESEGHDDHHDDHEDEHLHANEAGHDDHDDHGHDDHGHGHAAHANEFNTSSSTTSNESKANNNGGEPWGAVIGATLLVNVATFSGVLLLVLPAMYRGILKYRNVPIGSSPAANGNGRFFDIVIPGFAVGALLATAVFLVLPESVNYLSGGGHDDHADHADELGAVEDDHAGHGHRHLQEEEDSHAGEGSAAAKFGCSVLGGFLLPYIFAILFHHPPEEVITKQSRAEGSVAVVNEEEECASCVDNAGDGDVESGVAVAKAVSITETGRSDAFQDDALNTSSTPAVNKQLCASILLGDGFHNFADGFFIAAAFRSCSVAVAISIMLVTLFHEIAQELADFIVLTKFAKLPVWQALAFNFLSGLTVCLGGIIFLAANPTDTATGVILAMAGGVYINIAACETAPRIEAAMKGRGDRVLVLFSIILGTIPLGLILLDHKHCG